MLKFSRGTNSNPFYGRCEGVQVYKSALTDTELEDVTSYETYQAMNENFNFITL